MIDRHTAEKIAYRFINSSECVDEDYHLVIYSDDTIEKDYGWVFFYTSERYLRTGNDLDRPIGGGPLLVEKNNGAAVFLGTGYNFQVVLAEYEASRNLPTKRPHAAFVYRNDVPDIPADGHITIDNTSTLCGLQVSKVALKPSSRLHCPTCEVQAHALGLICPACNSALLEPTDPDWCIICRLNRRTTAMQLGSG
jgi:hypothetical protein